jgi:hypothetical protein
MEAKWPTLLAPIRANPVSKFGSLTYNRWSCRSCHATWNHMTMVRARHMSLIRYHTTPILGASPRKPGTGSSVTRINQLVSGCGVPVAAEDSSPPLQGHVRTMLLSTLTFRSTSAFPSQVITLFRQKRLCKFHVTGRPPIGLPPW